MNTCAQAIAEMVHILDDFGDPILGIECGEASRQRAPSVESLRVTRRGNVYDDTLRRSVFATWGMGSIRERRVIAQSWIDRAAQVMPC